MKGINETEMSDKLYNNLSTDLILENRENEPPYDTKLYEILYNSPFIIATIIYCITLIGCPHTISECTTIYPPITMLYLAIGILFSAILYTLQLSFYIDKKTNIIPVILELLIILFLTLIYDVGYDLKNHGGYNRIILFIFMGKCLFIFLITKLIGFKFKYPKTIITGILLLIFVIVVILFFVFKGQSCSTWIYGFKGSEIDNSEDNKCKINPPSFCYMNITDTWFDFTKLVHKSCDDYEDSGSFENIMKYLSNKNATRIGYPRTESWPYYPDSSINGHFNKRVISKIIDMDNTTISDEIKSNIEVITDFSSKFPEVNIDLKYNFTLVQERREKAKSTKKNPLFKNILYFFIDSLSRNSFKMKLPKFYKWIEKYYNK
jgi:hypothetical protein